MASDNGPIRVYLELGDHGLRVSLERLESGERRRRLLVAVQAPRGEERAVVGAAEQWLQRCRALIPLERLGRRSPSRSCPTK